jgi:GNAT superfamily N-acetyltransferase
VIEQLRSACQYEAALKRLKTGAPEFTTTCFATPMQIGEWAERGILSSISTPGAFLLLRRSCHVIHLSHVAADSQSLRDALLLLGELEVEEPIVADLVGRPADVEQIVSSYALRGFRSYRELTRMTRIGSVRDERTLPDMAVHKAVHSEASGVLAFLERLLDPLAEQIPELEDMESAADRGQILVAANGNAVEGVLIFQTIGFSTTLRYWFVEPRARSRGTGAALMRTFLLQVAGSRRIVLWVFSDNADGIAKYEHYGFRRENLVDRIMLKPVSGGVG